MAAATSVTVQEIPIKTTLISGSSPRNLRLFFIQCTADDNDTITVSSYIRSVDHSGTANAALTDIVGIP